MNLEALPARFWAKVDKTETCWLFTVNIAPEGYGKFSFHGRTRNAHRVVYEALVGPIPDGLDLDHLCRVRHCVNPAHLEPVTRAENARRGAAGSLITHCPKGHEYNETNTGVHRRHGRGDHRYCKQCNRERMRSRRTAPTAPRPTTDVLLTYGLLVDEGVPRDEAILLADSVTWRDIVEFEAAS
jgi:hypothetical protein